jgi:hypothetical protein
MEEHEGNLKVLDNDSDGIASGCLRSNVRRLDHGALHDCKASFRNYEFKHALCYLGEIDLYVLKVAALVFSQTIDVVFQPDVKRFASWYVAARTSMDFMLGWRRS